MLTSLRIFLEQVDLSREVFMFTDYKKDYAKALAYIYIKISFPNTMTQQLTRKPQFAKKINKLINNYLINTNKYIIYIIINNSF